MGIEDIIIKSCTQTAVYWGNPQEDGEGGKTFDAPVEIYCRWEDKTQVLGLLGEDDKGERNISRALVYLTQDVDVNGYLYLGALDDIYDAYPTLESSDANIDPHSINGCYVIKRFEKTPVMGSTTKFLRKAFLTPWLS